MASRMLSFTAAVTPIPPLWPQQPASHLRPASRASTATSPTAAPATSNYAPRSSTGPKTPHGPTRGPPTPTTEHATAAAPTLTQPESSPKPGPGSSGAAGTTTPPTTQPTTAASTPSNSTGLDIGLSVREGLGPETRVVGQVEIQMTLDEAVLDERGQPRPLAGSVSSSPSQVNSTPGRPFRSAGRQSSQPRTATTQNWPVPSGANSMKPGSIRSTTACSHASVATIRHSPTSRPGASRLVTGQHGSHHRPFG